MAENVVEILVKSRNDTKEGFDSAKLDAETAGDEAGQGFMAKFGSWLTGGQAQGGGGAGGIGGMLSSVFSVGPLGIAGLAVAAAAALTEIAGIVSGLAAATAGIGALAIVAIPTFEKVKAALADTPAQLAKQPKLIQDIIGQIRQLGKSFDAIGQSMMPQLLGIFNQGLGIAAQLMPVIATFAKAAAPAVSEVMTALSKSISSAGFKDFVSQFSKISGPAIEAIGAGFIKVAQSVGRLLTVMSAHDVVHALNIAFDIINDTIRVLIVTIQFFMTAWDQASSHIAAFSRAAQRDIANWAQDVEDWLTKIVDWFLLLPGKIMAALSNLNSMLFSAGQHAVQRLIDGLGSMIGSLGHMAASLASKVAGFFGLSPAKEGPLSGGGAPEVRGRHFAQAFAQGIASGVSGAGAAAGQLAGSVGLGGAGGLGGGGVQRIQIEFTGGDGQIIEAFKNAIRIRGGGGPNSVQVALGQRH